MTGKHIPVMLAEVLEALTPKAGGLYIDGTFGAGGYTSAILDAAPCRVIAFDRDITAVRRAAAIQEKFGSRLHLINRPFGEMDEAVREALAGDGGTAAEGALADGAVLDIGVSSMQLDEAERGFSFQNDGPLDMRMSAATDPATGAAVETGPSAADFLNTADEEEIANVIFELGDERRSRAIARAIVKKRAEAPLTRTRELADLVLGVFHGRKEAGHHPATRTFQALRIHVNDELGELKRGLAAAERLLKPGGRLVVVSFHSLEDRIVKQFLSQRSGKEVGVSRYLPHQSIKVSAASYRILNPRPLTPCQGELDVNPRSRSARLRAAERTGAPPWTA